ncbi:MAG: phosphotyrosine protein phosphatase [Robiginitomaculum sp.]|nr:MAG: phosphotyrosine protein phosphatase [Robiginitomaculum sp.]
MKNVLFICAANKLRSPTAEQIFADYPNIETDSAGINASAENTLSSEHLIWADIIFVMENMHRKKLSQKYKRHLNGQRIITLGIPDNYAYMDTKLIEILKKKIEPFLR